MGVTLMSSRVAAQQAGRLQRPCMDAAGLHTCMQSSISTSHPSTLAALTRLAGLDAVVGGGGWVGHPHALGVDGHHHSLQQ